MSAGTAPAAALAPVAAAGGPLPLTVLTGFLGAGKTTILNRLLAEPGLSDVAVVINEFGAVGIDHLLVEARLGQGIVELSNGCLCCTARGDLVDTLSELAELSASGRRPLRRVVVETTGIADPTPIVASLMAHPLLRDAYRLDGVVTVVDALAGPANLATREEAVRQVAVADRLVLTKTDLAGAEAGEALRAALRRINAAAPIVVPGDDALAPSLLECGLLDPASGAADPARWMGAGLHGEPGHVCGADCGHEHHDHRHRHHHEEAAGAIATVSLRREAPVALADIEAFLEMLSGLAGERILRMKAIVRTREDPERPVALHGVRGYLHPPARLSGWPPGTARETRLVLIGEALDERLVRDLFAAFTGGVAVDAPDRAALEANPLAVPGFSFR